MARTENILVSLEPRHAENILNGRKRVELRRRAMHVNPGATMWMYAKLPIGSVVGKARVMQTKEGTPATLWRRYGAVSGISKAEFFAYFSGVSHGIALILADAVRLDRKIALKELRERGNGFYPPQFFARMDESHPVLSASVA